MYNLLSIIPEIKDIPLELLGEIASYCKVFGRREEYRDMIMYISGIYETPDNDVINRKMLEIDRIVLKIIEELPTKMEGYKCYISNENLEEHWKKFAILNLLDNYLEYRHNRFGVNVCNYQENILRTENREMIKNNISTLTGYNTEWLSEKLKERLCKKFMEKLKNGENITNIIFSIQNMFNSRDNCNPHTFSKLKNRVVKSILKLL